MAAGTSKDEPILICGGGIIGCATAYYLAKRGVKSIILEATGLARGASGRAGGFLARDWCVGSVVNTLATKSFDMHMELAKEFVECDYRRLETLAVTAKQGCRRIIRGQCPDWVQQNVEQVSVMGTTQNTAQVNPWKLCNAFFNRAQQMVGTELKICEVTSFEHKNGHIIGVKVKTGELIRSSHVLIALGPWCSRPLVRSLNLPRFGYRKASSIILDNVKTTPNALFVAYTAGDDEVDTEWYPRVDGTLYVCGKESQPPLPDYTDDVKPSDNAIRDIQATIDELCPGLSKKTKHVQACYMPTTEDHIPVLGKVPGVRGLYIASGHAVWGILCSPATGAAMAQLMIEGKCTYFNLDEFGPARMGYSDMD